jgi:hypothetical protein
MADPSGVKLPGVGKVKPIYIVGGLGLVLGIVGYAWWKNGQANAGDTTGATDAMAASGEDSYIPPYAAFNTSGGVDLSQLPPLDNAAWSQRVQDLLVTIGFDPLFISNTIGKYLGRQQLNPAEADLVRTAIAMVGVPPTGQFAIVPTTAPITPGPKPVPKPTPTTKTITVWQGTRLGNDVFLGQLASRHNTTVAAIVSHNKWLIPIGKTKANSRLNKGWIIVIPVQKQVAA